MSFTLSYFNVPPEPRLRQRGGAGKPVRPATLGEVARVLDARLTARDERTFVRGAAADSRVVREGDLFFALRGRTDGAEFAPEAYLRGAVAAVASRPSRCRPSS